MTDQESNNQLNIYEAFCKAQKDFAVIPKNSEVKVKGKTGAFLYSYKYADLTTIIDCTRPSLAKYGLSFTQDYKMHDKLGFGIVTILMHKSGEKIESGFVPCEIKGRDMKDVAGQFTYGKRISLTAALGISADEDIDAASIEGAHGNSTQRSDNYQSPELQEPITKPAPMVQEYKPKNKLDELLYLVKTKKVPIDDMPEIIERSVGMPKHSKELEDFEIDNVISYINLMF